MRLRLVHDLIHAKQATMGGARSHRFGPHPSSSLACRRGHRTTLHVAGRARATRQITDSAQTAISCRGIT